MDLNSFLWIAWFILAGAFLYLWLTRPEIAKKHLIRNNIQAQVEANRLYNESDKLALILALLKDVDETKIIQDAIDLYIVKTLKKLTNEETKKDLLEHRKVRPR